MPSRKRLLFPVKSGRAAPEEFFPFHLLPAECQLHVLSFLNEVDKCRCALVCVAWSRLVRSWKLWRVADYYRRNCDFYLGPESQLVSSRKYARWKAWVYQYTEHLISRRASLLTLRACLDLSDQNNRWSVLLDRLLDNVHCRDLAQLDFNWTFTLLEPLDLKHVDRVNHGESFRKVYQVEPFRQLLAKLTRRCPRISKMRLPFDWSEESVSLLTSFQQLRFLELHYFWVFMCVPPSTVLTLTRSLPNLRSLTLHLLVPLSDLDTVYALESDSLEFLDVSNSRGLVLSRLRLPALRELRTERCRRGVMLDRRTRQRIQSQWPCLYAVLREGAPNLQVLNNEKLLPAWRDDVYPELTAILSHSCYCTQHLDDWLW